MTGPMHIRESDRGPVLLIRLGDKDLHVECGKWLKSTNRLPQPKRFINAVVH